MRNQKVYSFTSIQILEMSNRILLLYASVDGQTKKISNYLAKQLVKEDLEIVESEVTAFDGQLNSYDIIVLGSSIRYGVHHKTMIDFINANRNILDNQKTAFFSVNLVARKPEKNKADTNPYVIKFFKEITWNPQLIEVFAGKLDYKKYPFFDRIMIQFIMWMTKGPTDKNAKIEYTDWNRVKQFSGKIINMLS